MEILCTNREPALRCDSEHPMNPALFGRDFEAGFRCRERAGAWVKALLLAWLLMLARPATSTRSHAATLRSRREMGLNRGSVLNDRYGAVSR